MKISKNNLPVPVFGKFIHGDLVVHLSRHALFTVETGGRSVGFDTFAMLPHQTAFALDHKAFVSRYAAYATDDVLLLI